MINVNRVRTCALGLLLVASSARAQWPANGTALCTAAGSQVNATIASDGAGGGITTWQDYRNGSADIHVQRVNASGLPQWTANGVILCSAAQDQYLPTIVSDGAGGAIVTWYDNRAGNFFYDIYAQRVNAAGVPQWAANGVSICSAVDYQAFPTITTDGAGGAIITWMDQRSGINTEIWAQRVNASGIAQWAINGVMLCNAANCVSPRIVTDNAGGAIIAWHDFRVLNADIYTQRVNASGVPQWPVNGVALCTESHDQTNPSIASDGAGGAILAWLEYRSLTSIDIYSQRVNAAGIPQWTGNGVAICVAAGNQSFPAPVPIVADGSGGAIMAWHDPRTGASSHHIYAQRVNASGVVLWPVDGLAVCTAANEQGFPSLVTDGSGGAFLTWHDGRGGAADIYAQHVSGTGTPQWTANGIALCTEANNQFYPVMVSDNAGGAVVAWDDQRFANDDVYAQRFEFRYGYWGHSEPTVTSVADIRGDQGGKVKVNWKASDEDVFNAQRISYYSVWRATDVAAAMAAAAQGTAVRNPSEVKNDFKGRAVWTQHLQATDYYWEWVGNENAHYRAAYTLSAPTRSDSTSQGTANTTFFVSTQTADPYVFFDSNPATGHSVDNLAPPAPLFLTAQRVGYDVHLLWHRSKATDLKNYSVYRRSTSGVTPIPLNFLANAGDTVLVDPSAPVTALYYIVTATDVHENRSAPSNEAGLSKLTGVGDTPSISVLTVMQNYPNPFAGSTELTVGLPAKSDVHIDVFDVAGRRVRTQTLGGAPAGWRTIAVAGTDEHGRPLTSGVYFCRVSAAGATITKKMVIAR